MLELKQIDDNTIEYNGKLFKHAGEDVVSPLAQNLKDEVRYTVEHCVCNKVAVRIETQEQWDTVSSLLNRHWTSVSFNTYGTESIIACNIIECGYVGGYYSNPSNGYTIIPAATFIAHNTPQQDEVQYPWQKVTIYKSKYGIID